VEYIVRKTIGVMSGPAAGGNQRAKAKRATKIPAPRKDWGQVAPALPEIVAKGSLAESQAEGLLQVADGERWVGRRRRHSLTEGLSWRCNAASSPMTAAASASSAT